MFHLSLIFLLLVVGGCTDAVVQSAFQAPAGWQVAEPPRPGSEEADCANWYRTDWGVKLAADSGTIVIDYVPRLASFPDPTELALPDGVLRGIDHGEFGDGIHFLGTRDSLRQIVSRENAHGFIRSGDRIYALVGLAHLFTDYGLVLELRREVGGRWQAIPALDLGSTPAAFLQLDTLTVLVVTSDQLLRVQLADRLTVLHRNDVWPYVSPATSIVRDRNQNVFIGFRYAVAWLQPVRSEYHEQWLVPSSCPHQRRISNYECKCQP